MRTNSLVNNILAASTKGQPTPEVGMGVTVLWWTDRSAGTIVRVSPSGKTFWYTDDTTVRTDKNGMSESQEYAYTSHPDGRQHRAHQNKRGTWISEGHSLSLGFRRAYYDFTK